jgi:hypothetical protein
VCRGLARRSYFQMNGNMRAACRVLSRASSIAPSLTVGPAGRLWRARCHVCGGLADEEGLESLERHRAGVQEAGLCSQCSQWRWARAVDRAGVCASVLFRHWSAAVWGRLAVSSQGAGRVAVTCPLYASSDIDVWKHGPWKQAWGPPRRSSLEIGNPFSHSANNRCRRLSPVSRNVKITDHLCLGALQQWYLPPWPARPERFRRRFRHVLSFHVNSYAGNASNSPIDDVAASTTCRRLSRGAFKLLHAQSHQATQTAPLKSITTLSTLLCTFIHGSVEIKHGHLFEG